jgi:biopolymer transport protein ExbD
MASIVAHALSRSDSHEPMGEMNTTPLIDVMLVLLIMFIITIPIQTHSVGISLPGPARETPIEVDPVKNRLTVDGAGLIRWNGAMIDRLTLRRYLARSLALPTEPELQFEPSADARYLLVDELLADIRRAGVENLGFVGNERYADF